MIDEELEMAYEKAVYHLIAPPISWHVGEFVPALDDLFRRNNSSSAIFITASNPKSVLLPVRENEKRQAVLRSWLKSNQMVYFEGYGADPSGIWPQEESFFVINIDRAMAVKVGQLFGQYAVLYHEPEKPVELLFV